MGDRTDGMDEACGFFGMDACRTTPTKVPGLTRVTQLTASGSYSLALHDDGTVSSFGQNNYGQ